MISSKFECTKQDESISNCWYLFVIEWNTNVFIIQRSFKFICIFLNIQVNKCVKFKICVFCSANFFHALQEGWIEECIIINALKVVQVITSFKGNQIVWKEVRQWLGPSHHIREMSSKPVNETPVCGKACCDDIDSIFWCCVLNIVVLILGLEQLWLHFWP
jgi:hypothetical protein